MSSRQVGRSIPCLVFIHLQGLGSSRLADHVNEISYVKAALSLVNPVIQGAHSIPQKFHFNYLQHSGRYTSKTVKFLKYWLITLLEIALLLKLIVQNILRYLYGIFLKAGSCHKQLIKSSRPRIFYDTS